jgi:hypothetical protein
MKIQKLIFICAASLVAGCMPMTSKDYQISADGGKARGTCYTRNGRAIEFQRSGAVILFYTARTFLMMSISLPDGYSAVISPPTALLSSSALGESQILSAKYYYWYERGVEYTQPINEPIVGISDKVRPIFRLGGKGSTYYIKFYGGKKLFPDVFEITPPIILINEKSIKLPKITYKWESYFEITPIDC